MSIVSLEKPNTSRFLGIDYGQSKVGLAAADSETRIAFSYGTLKNDKSMMEKLSEIIEKENISRVVIGINHLETEFPSGPRSLGNSVSKLTGVKVEYQDEMFTTRQAQRNLIEKGVKGIKRFDDREAARLILQSWLDSQ